MIKKNLNTLFVIIAMAMGYGLSLSAHAQTPAVERALFLIDQQLFDEAIFTLARDLQIFPNNPRARILLASAYAARNGIVLVRFTAIAKNLSVLANAAPPAGEGGPTPLELIMAAFQQIPVLTTPQALDDINQAVAVLDGPGIQRGALLFRAILKIVIFKFNYLNGNLIRPETGCKIDPREYQQWMMGLEAQLQSAVSDVQQGMADPKIKAQIEGFKVDINKTMTGMASSVDDYSDDPDLMPDDMKATIELCKSK